MIDAKTIGEWKASHGCDCEPGAGDDCACPSRELAESLLIEREEMLAVLREIREVGANANEHGLEVDGGWLEERIDALIGKR